MSKSHFLVKLRKFESAPTVMYCILSSFIQENTQELSVTIYTHYSLAIWLRSFTKWVLQNEEGRGENSVNRKAACMKFKRKFLFQVFHLFLKDSSMPRDVARHLQTSYQQYAVHHSGKKNKINLTCRHDRINFLSFQKK